MSEVDFAIDAHPVTPLVGSPVLLCGAEPVNEGAARDYLRSRSWPDGLQDALLQGLKKLPVRFFICDNSGSMTTMDGMKFEEYDSQLM